MKKTFPLALFFCLFSFVSFGQGYVDLARFHYSTTPQNEFDSIGGNTTVEDFGLDVTLPIQLNESNVFLTGFNIDQITTKLHPDLNPTTISTVNLKLGYNKKHSDKWSATYMLLPKISSDFKNITSKDYQFGALALMKYNKKANLKYNIGVYYNGELFGPFIVPLLGLYYKSENGKFEANLTLPIWADVNYKLNKIVKVGANFSAFVRSYHLGENNAYVVKKSNDVFAYLQFNLTKSILLQTKIGYTIGRSYKVYNDNDAADLAVSAFRFGDDRTVLNPTFKDGLVFKMRLIYRFHIDK
tara:strand:- start:1080 stop:1976 length:897 start_codon:yes stop_codon:yes gene_type:complete